MKPQQTDWMGERMGVSVGGGSLTMEESKNTWIIKEAAGANLCVCFLLIFNTTGKRLYRASCTCAGNYTQQQPLHILTLGRASSKGWHMLLPKALFYFSTCIESDSAIYLSTCLTVSSPIEVSKTIPVLRIRPMLMPRCLPVSLGARCLNTFVNLTLRNFRKYYTRSVRNLSRSPS